MAGNSDRSNPTPKQIYFHVMASDDDDDCVIIKGSPLYESLLQSGYHITEDEGTSCVSSKVQNDHLPDRMEQELVLQINSKPMSLSNRLSNLWMLIYELLFQKKKQRTHTNRRILHHLRKCSVLDEDDADFLDWFVDSGEDKTDKAVKDMRQTKWMLTLFIPVIMSYIYTRIYTTTTTGSVLLLVDVLTILFLFYAVIQMLALIVGVVQSWKYEIEIKRVDEFVSGSEKLTMVFRKSLRRIQEAELIARGFTLVSQRNPLSRLEEGKKQTNRQCPTLRKLLFTCSRNSIYTFRHKTKQILELIPATHEMDITSGYLAFEPLENYGPCLQVSPEDSQSHAHLYRLTDGFSVSALKGISHLMMLHMSEFIKAVAVFYHYTDKYEDVYPGDVLRLVTELMSEINTWTDSVQTSIDFHNNSLIGKEREDRQMKEKNAYNDLYVAVHSLDLHLQSALTRVRCLAEDIESHMAQNDTPNLPHDHMDEWMQPIKAELTSCSNCYSDAVSRFERLCGKVGANADKDEVKLGPTWKDKEKAQTKIKEIEDYIIVDQVFEAYTDPEETELEYTDWEQPLSAVEKEKRRREKEEAIRVLSELKSVIKVRAKETEKRESAALNRARDTEKRETAALNRARDTEKHEIAVLNRAEETVKVETAALNGARMFNERLSEENEKGIEKTLNHDKNFSALVPKVEKSDITGHRTRFYMLKDELEVDDKQISNPRSSELAHPSSICDESVKMANALDDVSVISSAISDNDGLSESVNPRINKFRTKSIVTKLGVRRLRKGTLLDSDSDEEFIVEAPVIDCDSITNISIEPDAVNAKETIKHTKDECIEGRNNSLSEENNSSKVIATSPSALFDESNRFKNFESLSRVDSGDHETDVKHDRTEACETFGDNSEDESDHLYTDQSSAYNKDIDSISNQSPIRLSLEEKLAKLSGLDFNITSNIALMAAARSKDFVKSEEITFGGDVYGELSDSDTESS